MNVNEIKKLENGVDKFIDSIVEILSLIDNERDIKLVTKLLVHNVETIAEEMIQETNFIKVLKEIGIEIERMEGDE